MDDMLMIYISFNCESDAGKFFKLLNTEHPKIKFTFEKQVDNKFQF